MNEWKPIDTAPRDGKHIIVGNYKLGGVGFGYYKEKWQFAVTVAHYFKNGFYPSWCENANELPIEVTHWMELPEPPK